MLIKPYERIESDKIMSAKSAKTDIYYCEAYSNEETGESDTGQVVVVKSYLVKGLTDGDNVSFVKITYIFKHFCTSKIKDAKELKNADIDLRLQYVITNVYDENPNMHYFGSVIYEINDNGGQTVHTVFDNNQNVKELLRVFRGVPITDFELKNNANNCYSVMIESEDPMKLFVVRGVGKNYELRKETMLEKNRKISSFLAEGNITFESFDGEYYRDHIDSWNNGKLLQISQQVYAKGQQSTTADKVFINDYIVKKTALDDLATKILKPQMFAMISDCYVTYHDHHFYFSDIKYPFNKNDPDFSNRALLIYRYHLQNEINKVVDLLGDVRLLIHIDEMCVVIQCKFNDENDAFYDRYDVPHSVENVMFRNQMVGRFLYDTCKSKRYRKNKTFLRYGEQGRVEAMLDYFNQEEPVFWYDNPKIN